MTAYALLNVPLQGILSFLVIYNGVKLRPGYKGRFFLMSCIGIGFQFLIRFCFLTDIAWIRDLNAGKVLNIIMIFMIVFWGGSMVYEGWARIGVILVIQDTVFSFWQRGYWIAWEALTHASKESVTSHEQMVLVDFPSVIFQALNLTCMFFLMFVMYKTRNYSFPSIWFARVITIFYLAFGCTPYIQRIGFDGGTNVATVLWIIVLFVCMFFLLISLLKNIDRTNRRILYMKEQALSTQLSAMRTQMDQLRRFRHDVRKHRETLDYLAEEYPQMNMEASLVQYREELKSCESFFSQISYSSSAEADIGLAQISDYCEEQQISCVIRLRRLQFSGWASDECMLFGILLFNLVVMQTEGDTCNAVEIQGDCMSGQNIMRIVLAYSCSVDERKPGIFVEQDLLYLLKKHNGMLEYQAEGEHIRYLLSWSA